jgi:hypothetical protein
MREFYRVVEISLTAFIFLLSRESTKAPPATLVGLLY